MMRARERSIYSALGMAIFSILTGTACTPSQPTGGNTKEPSPNLRPVEDRPPYLCQLLPREALDRVTGNQQWRDQGHDLDITNGGKCGIAAPSAEQSLSMRMETRSGVSLIMDGVRKNAEKYSNFHGTLSITAGIGAVRPGYPSDTYTTYIFFGCDKHSVAINISGITISKGRNLINDVSALMRIAQNRYAKLANCKLSPPNKNFIPPGTDS